MANKYLITKESLIHISIILILIICFLLYYIYTHYYNKKNNNDSKENFTPIIRNMYRPHVRNIRIISEGFYNDNNNKINNLFRRFGLY